MERLVEQQQRRGQLAGLGAAVLFGCSAPLISTITGSGSALSIAGLLYGGATLALLAVRLVRGKQAETPIHRQDWPALATLTLLGGVVGPVALVLGLGRLPAASSSLLLNLEAMFTLADEALRLEFRCTLRLERSDDVRSRGDQKDAGLDRDPAGPGAPSQPMAVSLALGWRSTGGDHEVPP